MYRGLRVSPAVGTFDFVAKAPITQHLAGQRSPAVCDLCTVFCMTCCDYSGGGFFVGWGMAGVAVVRLYSADGIDPRLQRPPSIRFQTASKRAADACEAQDSSICQ